MKELIQIQATLKAPKAHRNTFGGYNYRSCEDILEALKPLCANHNCFVNIFDEIVEVGNRIYVKATASIFNEQGQSVSSIAFAREEESKKGMDAAQVTGAASSYARKYALNGLFAIDDTRDPDTYEGEKKETSKTQETKQKVKTVVTDADLNDKSKCDQLLAWAFKRYNESPNKEEFLAGRVLALNYEVTLEVRERFQKLFISYLSAKQSA